MAVRTLMAPMGHYRNGLLVLLAAGACSEPAPAASGSGDTVSLTDLLGPNPGKLDGGSGGDSATSTDSAVGTVAAAQCVAPGKGECDEASECGSGNYCDPCLRKCQPEREVCEPCDADVQCKNALVDGKPGSVCLAYAAGGSFCGRACLSAAGCPQGYTCESLPGIAALQCVPKTKSCGKAAGACQSDADCPFTTICKVEWGVCAKGCSDDSVCAAGKLCSLGHCVEPCTGDGDCAKISAEAKCVDKKCKIPGGCLAAEECPAKETHCDPKTHKCAPGCKTDFDCKDFANKCEASKCVPKGCTKNWECPYFHVCDAATGQCKKAEGLYCAKCDASDQDAKACGGKPNACFKFQDAEGKDKGEFCAIACGSDPAGACPQGWQCKDIKDDKGNSQGKLCLRPCYSVPVQSGGANP